MPIPPKPAEPMAVEPWNGVLPEALRARFSEDVMETVQYAGQPFAIVKAARVPEVLEYLKQSEQFDYLVDLTAVDYPKREERFELIYILYSFARNERIRVKAFLGDGVAARSVTSVYPAANWLEREAFDMFGIRFEGHPDLRRILLPDEWQGHPLRKDYGITEMDNEWVKANLGIDSGQ